MDTFRERVAQNCRDAHVHHGAPLASPPVKAGNIRGRFLKKIKISTTSPRCFRRKD